MATTRRIVSRKEFSLTREIEYISRQAGARDSRLVSLGRLLLFSASSGDAWLLEPAEGLALPLTQDGDYRIEGERFIAATRESGRVRAITGYPVADISRTARKEGIPWQDQSSAS